MNQAETITIQPAETGGQLWRPIVGIEATSLLERKGFEGEAAQKVLDENVGLIARCLPPSARGENRTGLVIGYVQSGKTLSFTAVSALARDNGYRMVIVLAGTKTNLLTQNEERLNGDLGIIGARGKFWRTLVNPRAGSAEIDSVRSALSLWDRYPSNPERCRTLLIVVMKNATRLADLQRLLSQCDLSNSAAIIIDDEGDQAGLNTKVRQNGESPTYASIVQLRQAIPTHTYLQYTATPQAPLLISRIDILSPEFQRLLEPGRGYVGGRDLFREGSPYVKLIPPEDLPGMHNAADGPPNSLERAMRLFFLGVAAGVIAGREGNRTMMLHPSHLTAEHETYASWARSIKQGWEQVLREPDGSPDLRELRTDFEAAYEDLLQTAPELPEFDALWQELSYAIEDTMVKVVNATGGRIPTFPWSESYGFILVGGAGLDRGFTVEGLTVTYMPRGAGTGTADTIQQRARFYGYKRDYLGLIRIFVDVDVSDAFTAYVEHEESVRGALRVHGDRSLSTWRRLFFLDFSLRPTRASVMALETMRGRSKEWVYARTPVDDPSRNRSAIDSFVTGLGKQLQDMTCSAAWTDGQRHRVARGLVLEDVYARLLVPLSFEEEDDIFDHMLMLLQMRAALDKAAVDKAPDLTCDLYLISRGARRTRAVTSSGSIENLFQGANPGTGYPGDREMHADSTFTVQVHHLDLHRKNMEPVAVDERVVAVRVPEKYRRDGVLQPDT